MKIGVIGSGIAGLVASRRLNEFGHDVTLFEKQGSIGIDAHSVDISNGDSRPGNVGVSVRADVPSRMFNSQQWPELWRLYEQLGVECRSVDLSQSFGELDGPTSLKLRHATRPAIRDLASLVSSNNRAILHEAKRLREQGLSDLQSGLAATMNFGEYLASGEYSKKFITRFLYPTLSSTVFTCSYDSLDQYPADCVLQTLGNITFDHADLFRTTHGTRDVAERVVGRLEDVRLNCGVDSIRKEAGGVAVDLSDGSQSSFDHLVVATQANHAIGLLQQPTRKERAVLESFTYESIPVSVHTDTRLMPEKKTDWSTFNMLTDQGGRSAMCTVWLNRFHEDWNLDRPVFQSINSWVDPKPSKTISRSVMQRPVVNARSVAALKELSELHQEPQRYIWFCGSYAGRGTPLLESGVQSAESVSSLISCGRDQIVS